MEVRTQRAAGHGDLLTLAFGTTVVMWAIGYLCRLFGDAVPAAVVFALLLACLCAGGCLTGRCTRRGAGGGALVGLLTGLVNLLIVGSLIGGATPNAIRAGAWLWIPGALIVSVVLTAVGAGVGTLARLRSCSGRAAQTMAQDASAADGGWSGGLAIVAACATFLLLGAGGLVTGSDEGLAVVDWPNTEGYNMFLYPLARMTGGIYLEHAHRLLGTLVGLATLVLAVHTQFTERRGWVKAVAWVGLLFVIGQGILGGLRVTGRLTLSTNPADTDPKVVLAIVHGVFGQLVFALLVALAVARSDAWQGGQAAWPGPSASTDRTFGIALGALLVVQLVLGALVRHFTWALDTLRYGLPIDPARLIAIGRHMLNVHVAVAVLVALLAVAVGVRAWGVYHAVPTLRRLGATLLILIAVQVALGIAALIATTLDATRHRATAVDVLLTTAHQTVGAALLAWVIMIVMWNYRLIATTGAGAQILRPAPTGGGRA